MVREVLSQSLCLPTVGGGVGALGQAESTARTGPSCRAMGPMGAVLHHLEMTMGREMASRNRYLTFVPRQLLCSG